jgi:acetyl-CoA acetyltransferase
VSAHCASFPSAQRVDPLRLLGGCQESDGAVAVVVTSLERARDLRQPPVRIAAAAQGASTDQQMMTRYYSESITGLPEMGLVAAQLYATAEIGPADVQIAVLYDHFTPFVLTQLEEFGFCGRGEAKDFVRGGALTTARRDSDDPKAHRGRRNRELAIVCCQHEVR